MLEAAGMNELGSWSQIAQFCICGLDLRILSAFLKE